MTVRRTLYRGAVRLARRLLPVAAPFNAKLRRGLDGRRATVERLLEWARASRDRARPLVWVHAPSVGEALMAQAIIACLRERRPELQVAFTHFSPSAERLEGMLGADFFGYLPWDLPSELEPVLDALGPAVIAYVRTEIWPELVDAARERGVPSALVNAVLSPGSGRLGRAGRWLLGPSYAHLSAVGVVSPQDAALFDRLRVARDRVHVTGDARFDQVWERVTSRERSGRALPEHPEGRLTLVAGSTWPEDEERLVPAVADAAREARLRLVIAPHEPEPTHLRRLERLLERQGLEHARLTALEAGHGPAEAAEPSAWLAPEARLSPVVVLDRLGVLADAYAAADVAYVGGGFGRDGLHSVVEPAALGVPVVFGPGTGSSREAVALSDAGGGIVVAGRAEMRAVILGMVAAPESAHERGARAREFVRSRLGGAAANADLLLSLLDDGGPS